MSNKVERTARDTVEKYLAKTGMERSELASIMGIRKTQVFTNKINPDCHKNILTLSEAIQLQLITQDHSITNAMFDLLEASKPDVEPVSAKQAFRRVVKEFGEASGAYIDADEDDLITAAEELKVRRALDELIDSAIEFRASMKQTPDPAGKLRTVGHLDYENTRT